MELVLFPANLMVIWQLKNCKKTYQFFLHFPPFVFIFPNFMFIQLQWLPYFLKNSRSEGIEPALAKLDDDLQSNKSAK